MNRATRGRAGKALVAAAMVCGFAAEVRAAPPEAGPIEWSAGVSYLEPGLGDFDVYDDGVGLEVQCRYWLWDVHGLAFSLGMERWDARSDGNDWAAEPSGSLDMVSFGVSWVGLIFESEKDLWTVEGGLRYHVADSDMKIRVGDRKHKVDIDDGLTGLVALGYERRLSESFSVGVALSYQPDLIEGEASFDGGKLRDNKLEAWGIQLALRWRL